MRQTGPSASPLCLPTIPRILYMLAAPLPPASTKSSCWQHAPDAALLDTRPGCGIASVWAAFPLSSWGASQVRTRSCLPIGRARPASSFRCARMRCRCTAAMRMFARACIRYHAHMCNIMHVGTCLLRMLCACISRVAHARM